MASTEERCELGDVDVGVAASNRGPARHTAAEPGELTESREFAVAGDAVAEDGDCEYTENLDTAVAGELDADADDHENPEAAVAGDSAGQVRQLSEDVSDADGDEGGVAKGVASGVTENEMEVDEAQPGGSVTATMTDGQQAGRGREPLRLAGRFLGGVPAWDSISSLVSSAMGKRKLWGKHVSFGEDGKNLDTNSD